MPDKIVLLLLARLLRERRRDRSSWQPPPRQPSTRAPAPPAEPAANKPKEPSSPPAPRLVGPPGRLEQLTVVARDTVALVFEEGLPHRLAEPKTYLWPPLVPWRRTMTVVVLSTLPVPLLLTVEDLLTADGYTVSRVELRIVVQLAADDRYASLNELAAVGPELELHLLQRVEEELGALVRKAVRANPLNVLQRMSLAEVLKSQGLPGKLAGHVLECRELSVTEVEWPEDLSAAAEPASSSPAELELSVDARLRRVWSTVGGGEVRGIAAARAGGSAAVIAVPEKAPGQADLLDLRDAYRRELSDRELTLVVAPADSYTDLVRAWFAQVNNGPARLVSVNSIGQDELRIEVDRAGRATDSDEPRVGRPAEREALRRLLPHADVVFVATDRLASSGRTMR